MHDDETEVFNLANRCLETSISDPKTWELLAIRGPSKDRGGMGREGDDSWNERKPRYFRLHVQSETLIGFETSRLVQLTICEVKIWSFSRKEIVSKNSFRNYYRDRSTRTKKGKKSSRKNHRIVSWNNSSNERAPRCKRLWTNAIKTRKNPR